MSQMTDQFKPGDRVRITQQTPRQSGVWQATVEGVVVRFEQRKTGSWFAHSKDDKLWLDRLIIRKDDGEIVIANLDRFSHVEAVGGGGAVLPDTAETVDTQTGPGEAIDPETGEPVNV